jgi:hypothetical protein
VKWAARVSVTIAYEGAQRYLMKGEISHVSG